MTMTNILEIDGHKAIVSSDQREKAEEFLRKLIPEGLASGPATPIEPDYFERMRERARQRDG